ncbi:hypothetical protein E5N72_08645 [Pseudoalteromonas sp. MEBiC 03607]|nr:hypothetical protein E5N72_08645 [Pseudoalteromonas sp. MEBiC 03607]
MFNELKIQPVDFLDNYEDANGETRKQYRLDRDSTMTLVTKYDTARRYAVVRRWREFEEGYGLLLPSLGSTFKPWYVIRLSSSAFSTIVNPTE